jgi:hypothetical protein
MFKPVQGGRTSGFLRDEGDVGEIEHLAIGKQPGKQPPAGIHSAAVNQAQNSTQGVFVLEKVVMEISEGKLMDLHKLSSGSNNFSRHACYNGIRGDLSPNNSSSCDDRAVSDARPWQDYGVTTNPDIFANEDIFPF